MGALPLYHDQGFARIRLIVNEEKWNQLSVACDRLNVTAKAFVPLTISSKAAATNAGPERVQGRCFYPAMNKGNRYANDEDLGRWTGRQYRESPTRRERPFKMKYTLLAPL